MIVLGHDPPTGVTAIRVGALGVEFAGTWNIDVTSVAAVRAILDSLGEPVALLGVEQPEGVYRFGKDVNQHDAQKAMKARVAITRDLMVTRGRGERFAAIVETVCPGVRVFYATADKIRRAVLSPLPHPATKTALDRHVAAMVPRLIRGWPERSNDHNRDAAVAALWAVREARIPAALRAQPKRNKRSR